MKNWTILFDKINYKKTTQRLLIIKFDDGSHEDTEDGEAPDDHSNEGPPMHWQEHAGQVLGKSSQVPFISSKSL